MDELTIPARFNGPARSGNGGYTAGLVAARLAPGGRLVAQVTLRVPPPLDRPLQVTPDESGGLRVYDGSRLIAEAGLVELADPPPVAPVSLADAVAAAAAYPGFQEHPFPRCFVCGPERATGDGLRIFPGPLADGRTAAPWTVPDDRTPATVWAALDCPGGWAIIAPGRPYVLGRMAATVHALPPAGMQCVVLGGVLGTDGRKAQVHTALYGESELLAWARSTWIAI